MESIILNNRNKIRALMLTGVRVTTMSILFTIGTSELRKYLSDLRKEGLIIRDKWIEKDGKHFKQYWIEIKN